MTLACPTCSSTTIKKNGHIHNGKQNHRCLNCGRQFVIDPQNKIITDEKRSLIRQAYSNEFHYKFSVYYEVIPWLQHRPVEKESGKTSYIERFNNTLRQRCSRLVRKTLSFSKKLTNHIGMIKYFICDYNHNRALFV